MMFSSKRRALLFMILSILFALIAVLLFTNYVADTQESLGEMAEVHVAATDIPAGSEVSSNQLETMEVPMAYYLDTFVEVGEDISDQISAVAIPEGEILTQTMMTDVSNVPEGHRMVELREPVGVFDGDIEVLDRVDLIGSYESSSEEEETGDGRLSEQVIEGAEVLRVATAEDEIVAIGVALTMEEAEQISWIKNYGVEVRAVQNHEYTEEEEEEQEGAELEEADVEDEDEEDAEDEDEEDEDEDDEDDDNGDEDE